EEVVGRRQYAVFGEAGGELEIDIFESVLADPSDRALDPEFLRLAEEIAVRPVGVQRGAVIGRVEGAGADHPRLRLADLDDHRHGAVGADRLAGPDADG